MSEIFGYFLDLPLDLPCTPLPVFITHEQFHMTSDQFEKSDDHNWSQKTQDSLKNIFILIKIILHL